MTQGPLLQQLLRVSSELPPLPDLFGNPLIRGFREILPAADIDWRPQTPGWYLLAIVLGVFICRSLWRLYRRWLRNRYRREALQRLEGIGQEGPSVVALNELLKTTAIVASSRQSVAGLSGHTWVAWLDRQTPAPVLSDTSRQLLSTTLYKADSQLDPSALSALERDIRAWLLRHRDQHAPY